MTVSKQGYEQTYNINHASVLKRFMAFLIDVILLVVVISGFMYLFSAITNYDGEYAKLEEKYKQYGILKEEDGVLSSCEIIYDANGQTTEEDLCYQAWYNFSLDEEAVKISNKCDSLMMFILAISALCSLLLLEFLLPILLKNGRTIGGWVMHVGLISKENIKISKIQLFARCIIGRYAIETMAPLYCLAFAMVNPSGGLLGLTIFIIILCAELIIMAVHPNRCSINNIVANVVCVDMDTQYFAESIEELELLKMKKNKRD